MGGVSYYAEGRRGYRQDPQLGEQMSAGRHGKTRAPSAMEKGLQQALPVCCCGKTPPCTRGVYEFGDDDCPVYCLLELIVHTMMT